MSEQLTRNSLLVPAPDSVETFDPARPAHVRTKRSAASFLSDLVLYDALGIGLLSGAGWVWAVRLHREAPLSAVLWAAAFAVLWGVGAGLARLYDRTALIVHPLSLAGRVMLVCGLVFGVLLLCAEAAAPSDAGLRTWVLSWGGGVVVWACVARLFWRRNFRRFCARGGCIEHVMVVARLAGEARRLADTIERQSRRSIRVTAAVDLPEPFVATSPAMIENLARAHAVDRVVISDLSVPAQNSAAVLEHLARCSIDASVLLDRSGIRGCTLGVSRIGSLRAMHLGCRPLTPAQLAVKRAEDLLIGGALTLALAPVLGLLALAIRLDSPGPIIFRQRRTGLNGRIFWVWKFRTMYHHARDEAAIRQTSRGDRRVTPVGRILRRTSLDELPQLFNVLAGDMSIVGPRPHPLGMTANGVPMEEAVSDYDLRHRMKPGITGWAQINGARGEIGSVEKLQRRVALDCHYIASWSLKLDLLIILRTSTMVVYDPDAY